MFQQQEQKKKHCDTNEKQKDDDDLQHFCVYPYLLQAKAMFYHFLFIFQQEMFQQHDHFISFALHFVKCNNFLVRPQSIFFLL